MMQAEGGQIASFREIHKNAWLKRIPPNTSNKLLSQKKVTVERWWTVFCVHGDVEPFLEGYTEAGGVVASHMPRWRAPLARAIHVSGSVGPARPHAEYEFVVALQDGTVRLIAPSWESMQDWVDTLRNKLREMKILSPKENVYSKAPEQTRPRAPTRDPTSPLPPPPPGPITRVPGTEPSIRPLPVISNIPLIPSSPPAPPPLPSVSTSTLPSTSNSMPNSTNQLINNNFDEPIVDIDVPESDISNFPSIHVASNNENDLLISPSCSYDVEQSNSTDNPSLKKDLKCISKSKGCIKIETEDSTTPQELADFVSLGNSVKNISKPINTSVTSTESLLDYNKILNVAASQKSIDDSISKVEMDFSKLVFNSEYPYKFNLKCNDAAGSSVIQPDQKSVEFTSGVANVSGMNICLVDSVLEHRMKTESDKNFFDEFDADDVSVLPSTSTSTSNITITESGDIKAKYAQVDLKAKKFEKFKKHLLEPSVTKKVDNIDIPVANIKHIQSNIVTSNKSKPSISPRTIIFKNCDDGTLTNPTNIYVTNELSQGNIRDDSNETSLKNDNSKFIKDKPVAAERKKCIPNRLINEYDNQSIINISESPTTGGSSPHNSSNVTIITVSNDNINTDPVIVNDGFIKINQSTMNSSDNKNINISPSSDNVTINKCENGKSIDKNEVSNYRVSIGSGYGHVRHSTTIGVDNNSNTRKNSTNFDNQLINKVLHNEHKSENISPKSPIEKFLNTNILQIEHKPSTSNRFSFDQPKIDSLNSLKVVTTSLPNTPKQLDTTLVVNMKNAQKKGEGLYESVFTPFTVIKGSKIIPDSPNHIDSANCSISLKTDETTSKNTPAPNNYEFLSWKKNESANLENSDGASSSNFQNSESQISEMIVSYNHQEILPAARREINLSEYRPQPMPKKYDELPSDNIHPLAKHSKHGLFTRGLTELNIVTKFRNIGQSNSSKAPLLKNSQFYSYVEIDPPIPSTSSTDQKQENKKNNSFSTKFNHLFKSGDDKTNSQGSHLSNVKRIESTLRRNWSEHNDRTILPIVKNAAELKAHRSRPLQKSSPLSQNLPRNLDEKQTRRRSSSLSESHSSSADTSCNSLEIPKENFSTNVNGNENPPLLQPMNLREKQVAKLRGEMALVSGVRLRLRSKDSLGEALALADGFGTVWVCGWKQQTHPQLYNALRIGDQLTAVGDTIIKSVKQAKNALKDLFYVELLIKRLPHAHVYTLKKNTDTQDLGLVLDNATIVAIMPGSPAARMKIPPNGTLTEVNGRPLNLLLKKGDSQVKNRLNAIGKDVSIVVQPTEFVALLKSSLRNMRNHKDYIVQ